MTRPERIPLGTLLDDKRHGRERLERIAIAARKGALFVYPTETIYGLGGIFNIPGVKEKILQVKKKPHGHPLILIAPNRSFFKKIAVVFPPSAEQLTQVFWPGMLTLVLPSPEAEQGIAVRVSSHPFITALFRHIDTPIFSTSANRSGDAYVNDPDFISSVFSQTVDFFIDAGPLPPSPPSTIVKIGIDNRFIVLREGTISITQIISALR
ncbi:MAG: L-threonylcarbamoyladenylate synthase [Chitinispirillaceae bacterium]|jgi:L-threonylcarbamoyladenylate synthase